MLHKALQQFLEDVAWGELDYLLVDLPPGTGDVSMTLAQLLPQAKFVIVTTPQPTAQKVARRSAEMAHKVDLEIAGIVENMSVFTAPDGERYPDQEHRLHAREVVPGGRSVTESEATPVDESAEHDEPDTDQHEQTDDFCAGRAVGLLARASGRDDRLRRRDGRRDRAARARRGLRRRGRGGLLSRRSGWWIRLLRHGVLAPCSAGDGAPDIYGQAT